MSMAKGIVRIKSIYSSGFGYRDCKFCLRLMLKALNGADAARGLGI
jgi:hypothetical protein